MVCHVPAAKAARLIYLGIYRRLEFLTPVAADCGRLCGSKCCGGGRNDGMILFPLEESVLEQAAFLTIENRRMEGLPVRFAVCKGYCDRSLRPLSCRLYPFAPQLQNGEIRIIADPRAAYRCPLLLEGAKEWIEEEFLQTAAACVSRLRRLRGADRFLSHYTAMLQSYGSFIEMQDSPLLILDKLRKRSF